MSEMHMLMLLMKKEKKLICLNYEKTLERGRAGQGLSLHVSCRYMGLVQNSNV